MLELSGTTTFQDFDGYGRPNRLGDHMVSLTAGFTFHLGKVGWNARLMRHLTFVRMSGSWIMPISYPEKTSVIKTGTTATDGRSQN